MNDEKKLKKSVDGFRVKLNGAFIKIKGDDLYKQNHFGSPFSPMFAIGMILLGSKGKTKSQIEEVVFSAWKDDAENIAAPHVSLLYLTKELTKPFNETNDTFSFTNRFYIQKEFEIDQNFMKETGKCYHQEAGDIDFGKSEEARSTINGWVEETTRGKIKDLLPKNALNSDTKLVLVNSVYFSVSWNNAFNSSLTIKHDFYILRNNGTTEEVVEVDMMTQEGNFTFYKLDVAENTTSSI